MIDQVRFPPDNVTAIKIIVRTIDKKFNDIAKTTACIPDIFSDKKIPRYQFRMELRNEVEYSKDALLFLIFLTIDEKTEDGNPCILGYSFFPLFLDKQTNEPAKIESSEILLHDGQYQLPVFCQEYPYALDFDFNRA